MSNFGRTILLATAATIALPEVAFADGGVSLLGALPNAPLNSSGGATGVSADGTVAVGSSSSTPPAGSSVTWRWTTSGGMVSLGFLPGDDNSVPHGISGDGDRQEQLDLAVRSRLNRWTRPRL